MRYELERERRYAIHEGEDTWEKIAKSGSREELVKKAGEVRLRNGKTFYEILRIIEIDEYGDIIDSEILKETTFKMEKIKIKRRRR